MDALWQDIRYALRGLRRTPGFALVALLTIGLAVGANATVFSWAETFVLRPYPAVPDADRLVTLWLRDTRGAEWAVSYPAYRDWREGSRSFEGLAAHTWAELSLRTEGTGERVWGDLVTGNFFDVLRVRPILGRTFLPDEEAQATPVAVISHRLWQRRFAGDSGVVGRRVTLNGQDVTIVGVVPPAFAGAESALRFDLWVPISLMDVLTPQRGVLARRDARDLWVFGRLRPGISIERGRRDVETVHRPISALYPEDANTMPLVRWKRDDGAGGVLRPVMGALLGVTVLVLLITCTNLANLLLARAVARRREIGIRLAVGASRGRLTRQLLTESLVLAAAGGIVGVLLASWGKEAFGALVPTIAMPVSIEPVLDARVIWLTLLVALSAGVAFGLAPAAQATRVGVTLALRDGAPSGPAARARLRGTLVATQVALSVVALVCAGLFVRGLQQAQTVDTGLRAPAHVLLIGTSTSLAGLPDSGGAVLVERLLGAVRGLPGVDQVSVASRVPLGFDGWPVQRAAIEGYTFQSDEPVGPRFNQVGPGYFEMIGTSILRGRGVTEEDRTGALPVAVVNETFARRYWPRLEPVGRHITWDGVVRTVVGVARDAKYQWLTERPRPVVYAALAQSFNPAFTVHVRAAGDPRRLEQALRRTFERLDPRLPFLDVRTLAEQVRGATVVQRLGATMLAVLGTLALAIAAAGMYGVLAYSISQRTREIGVRIAVGASQWDILALVVGGAMRLALMGLAVGLVLAVGAGRLLRNMIFGVSPLDPVTFGAVIVLLAAVALLAARIPARRAARVDPIVALSAE